MAASASLELQRATASALSKDAGVQAALAKIDVGGKSVLPIFDKVPDDVMQAFAAGKAPTYVTLGDGSEDYELAGEQEDDNDNYELTKHTLAFHVYSQTVGLLEAKTIALALRSALVAAYAGNKLDLPTNDIKLFDPVRLEYARLEDGFTSHAAVVMRCHTQPKT